MPNLNYSTVGSNDIDKAKAFYDQLLGSIGWVRAMDLPTGSRIYGNGESLFGVMRPFDGQVASVGNGSMIGFLFDSGEAVAQFHAKAISLGATNDGDPGERAPDIHFGYFRDLDGNKLCGYKFG